MRDLGCNSVLGVLFCHKEIYAAGKLIYFFSGELRSRKFSVHYMPLQKQASGFQLVIGDEIFGMQQSDGRFCIVTMCFMLQEIDVFVFSEEMREILSTSYAQVYDQSR